MTGSRWCPKCGGAKRPSEDICLACGITAKLPADETPRPIPTHAVLPGRGRVRVLSYDGNGMFTVLTNRDVKVSVHRDRLTFLK